MKVFIFVALIIWVPQILAREIAKEPSFKLSSAAKLTGIGSTRSGAGLLRLRIEPSLATGSWKIDAAYDNQLRVSGAELSIASALPTNSLNQFRLWPIAYEAKSGVVSNFGQLDRAFFSFHSSLVDVTAGRQSIGWGRGNFFSAVDLFAPFEPLQVDQEWRSGVDALSVDVRVSDTASLQAVAVGADSFENAILAGRARGYFGSLDIEVEAGKRALDIMYGTAGSCPISDAELHWEYALFQTPSEGALRSKFVLGASNNFQVGSGLRFAVEYHYSGFGGSTASQIETLLASPAFLKRLSQGATQIIGNQAVAASASYTFSTQWIGALTILQSAMDSSGVLNPSVTWDFSDVASLFATGMFSWGSGPIDGKLQSQFGEINPMIILQLRVYD